MTWSQEEAIDLAKLVHNTCILHRCYVALSGGCLYYLGYRKDCDLVIYRSRQVATIDKEALLKSLALVGFSNFDQRSEWLTKCEFRTKAVDLLFPDAPGGGEYPQ